MGMKLTSAQLKEGQIAQATFEFLAELENIKAEFIRVVTEAHPTDAVAFIEALDTRNEAINSAQAGLNDNRSRH